MLRIRRSSGKFPCRKVLKLPVSEVAECVRSRPNMLCAEEKFRRDSDLSGRCQFAARRDGKDERRAVVQSQVLRDRSRRSLIRTDQEAPPIWQRAHDAKGRPTVAKKLATASKKTSSGEVDGPPRSVG